MSERIISVEGNGSATGPATLLPDSGPPRARPSRPPAPRAKPSLRVLAIMARNVKREEAGWLDTLIPWMISSTFNISLVIIAAFLILAGAQSFGNGARQIIIPNSFDDPALSDHPGGVPHAGAGDPSRDAAQNLKDIARSQGWAVNDSANTVPPVGGGSGDAEALSIIASGGTGSTAESDTGKVAAYGTPGGGAGTGPKSSFYGTGGNATRIVYLIDRTGSMIDVYGIAGQNDAGSVKGEVSRSVSALVPLQFFSVVVFTGKEDGAAQIMGTPNLVRATPENKKLVLSALSRTAPEGGNRDDDLIVKAAFRKAFELHPQLIYFLTDGNVSPAVTADMRELNKDHEVVICSIKFTDNQEDPALAKAALQVVTQLAAENGGMAKEIKR